MICPVCEFLYGDRNEMQVFTGKDICPVCGYRVVYSDKEISV
jgi:rRNA maturation protein Nop10